MTSTPRIRALLPGRLRLSAGSLPTPGLPASGRAGEATQVFRDFGRTLGRLERAAALKRDGLGGSGTGGGA